LQRGAGIFMAREALMTVTAHDLTVCKEVVMQTYGLVILTLIGMTLIAGLSIALYVVLPLSVLECASRHGRFAGLETRDEGDQGPTGDALVSDFDALLLDSP
jgi:hypothetical protein